VEPEELQRRLRILFDLIEQGKMNFGSVPRTIAALQKVRRLPDGSFDLTTVESPVRALCLVVDEMIQPEPPPADYETLDELPTVTLPKVRKRRSSENDFLRDLVEAANVVRQYLVLVAGLWPARPLDRLLRGILMGHMVRVFKLYDSMMLLVVEHRGEIAPILSRVLIDTVINLRYLLRHPSDEEVGKYIQASLAYEKKLMEEVQSRMRQRPQPLPIELSMLGGIEETFRRVGVDPASITAREWRGASTFQKAREAGLEVLYEFGFRPTSHQVHGTWHDLEFYHLEEKDGQYRPETRFSPPRPQVVEMASVASLETSIAYLDFVVPGTDADEMKDRLQELLEWFVEMGHQHERWSRRRTSRPRR